MIKLVVGLGNPGLQYEKNRHNAGLLFLDYLFARYSGNWSNESKFHGILSNCVVGKSNVLLLKPQTYMNRSGLSVGSVVRYYKLKVEEVLVVHDELDIAVGAVKLKKGGGHAGHNGLRDIISNLGEKGFYRLRIGIGRPGAGGNVSNYVLSNPSKEEQKIMEAAYDLIEKQIEPIVSGDEALAMNKINMSK